MTTVNKYMLQQTESCVLCGEVPVGTGCSLDGSSNLDFAGQATEQIYERGQAIFKEQSASTFVYAIKKGRVKLYRTDNHGNRQVINLLGVGDIFGLRTLLANEAHSVTAEAIEPTSLCVVPRQKLLEMFKISDDLAQDLMGKLSAELKVTEEIMISVLHHSVRQRAARLLLALVDQGEKQSGKPMRVVKLQRTEMAQLIGTTPESLSRTLHLFGEMGLIETTRTRITLLDAGGLKVVLNGQEKT